MTFDLQQREAAEHVIDDVLARHSGRICLTCSFQAEDMVVLDLVRKREPDVPVLFLETGYHFAETYEYRDRITAKLGLNLINVLPAKPVVVQESELGLLFQSNPSQCCQLRKVEPLMKALEGYDIWFTGLRREQSATRKNLKPVEQHVLPTERQIVKVSPLAAWDWKQVWRYTVEHEIDYLPLYDRGYQSIGCEPCTRIPEAGADPRSGRWGGVKLECGIHTFSKAAE